MSYESAAGQLGHISLGKKTTGKRSAGKPHAAFDAAGAGNVVAHNVTGAPVLDPTDVAGDGDQVMVGTLRHSQRKRGATDRPDLQRRRHSLTLHQTTLLLALDRRSVIRWSGQLDQSKRWVWPQLNPAYDDER